MAFSLFKRIRNIGGAFVDDKKASKQSFEEKASGELVIENVRPGGVIHLRSVGPDMEEMDLRVIGRHTYRQGNYEWYELECDKGGAKVWIDIEIDDEVEVGVTLREIKLPMLGITKQDLVRFDDDEEGELTFEGRKFWLEDSDSCQFLRNGDVAKAEELYYWDFEDEGNRFIGVEKWGDSEYSVYYGEFLRRDQIEVFSLS